MLSVTKQFSFEAAHHLPHYDGACHNLHGHSYKLEVTVSGALQTTGGKQGMIMDFKDLKRIVGNIISVYDHSYLNDHFQNPTAEIMVKQIATDIMSRLPRGVVLVSCKLWETNTSYAEWSVTLDALKDLIILDPERNGGMKNVL